MARRPRPVSRALRCNVILLPRLCSCQRSNPLKKAGKPFACLGLNAGLVGVPGIEPGTSSLSGTRSNQLSYTPVPDSGRHRPPSPAGAPARHPVRGGGGSRARTGGIQLAKLALYQLSYAPGAGRLSRRALKRSSGTAARAVRRGCGEDFGLCPVFTFADALRRGCSLERR